MPTGLDFEATINGLTPNPESVTPKAEGVVMALLLRIHGTAAGGGAGVTAADIPDIIVTRQAGGIYPYTMRSQASLRQLLDLNEAWFGRPLETAAAAGANFEFSCLVPFFQPGHPSGIEVNDPETLTVELAAAVVAANFTSCNVDIHSITENVASTYVLTFERRTFTMPGAGGIDKVPLDVPNVCHLMLSDISGGGTEYDRITIEPDNHRPIDDISRNALRLYSNIINQVEAAALAQTLIPINALGDPLYSVSKTTFVTFFGGIGTINGLVFRLHFNDSASATSYARVQARALARSTTVRSIGVKVPTVARAIQGATLKPYLPPTS